MPLLRCPAAARHRMAFGSQAQREFEASGLQVYNVFGHIMPVSKPVNVFMEADPTAQLVDYLKAVKYRPLSDPASFRYALQAGERDTLHAILKWALSQLPTLQRRALVGFYLAMPDIPQEFRGVPDIAARIEEIQGLQADFKELHRNVDAAKAELPNAAELRKQIMRKENERASLNARIAKSKDKAEGCSNAGSVVLLDLCACMQQPAYAHDWLAIRTIITLCTTTCFCPSLHDWLLQCTLLTRKAQTHS